MATLLLQVAGSAIGTMVGGPIGSAIGSAIGATVGGMIDQRLLSPTQRLEGPRLKSLDGISATEGAPIPRAYGRVRLGGQVIWATKFEEQVAVVRAGKSGGKSSLGPKARTTTYSYYANVAIGLCEGPIAMVRRIWADGKPLDLTKVTMRVYRGDESQMPDPLILARQGETPAYRGLAYVVFERLPLENYGNRLPQLSFEVVRPVAGLAQMVRGVDLIPGATEFGYATGAVSRTGSLGASAAENRNQLTHPTDLDASLDALEALCPNANSVALVASWFGDDLRAGVCRIRPAVDTAAKTTTGQAWSVAGLERAGAPVVSENGGQAAYGGTPSDRSVVDAIAELKQRGKSVVFYPFVMMDIAQANSLPDPYGDASQPAYPWRGRITCSPAPGLPGSPDGSAAAAAEVAAFFGSVTAGDFSVAGDAIRYSGPDEWSYSRFLLHNAALAKAAGGVDAFIIGSEFIGLTRIRASATDYAAAGHFRALAAEVRALLGPAVKLGYAADWTEYGAHIRNGGAEVGFPLDALWADANIDFVGIDYYPPVADWRDGREHRDALAGYGGRDVAYFRERLAAGEAFEWYYASASDREVQNRTPISDGAFGKPWIYRAKDLKGWWSNLHHPRIGGVEQAATGWIPASKPIWLTEVGCPAVDKGANAPNVFPDPKSAESGVPPFSAGTRDDLVQARYLEAVMRRFDPALPGFIEADNPVSSLYGGRMVDAARIHIWAWDARPYPAFPHFASVWGDAANWQTGHWINGRIEGLPLDRLIAAICADFDLQPPQCTGIDGFLDGYVIDRAMSARAALEPLLSLYGVHALTSAGAMLFAGGGKGTTTTLDADDFVPDRKGRDITRIRAQETELPRQITLGFSDAEAQYKRATEASRRLDTPSRAEQGMETSAVLVRAEARRLCERLLQEAWIGRETAEFTLRPGLLGLECGDLVAIDGQPGQFLLTRIVDGNGRRCEARRIEPAIFDTRISRSDLAIWQAPAIGGPPLPVVLHLPFDPGDPTPLALLALRAEPWKGPYTVWRSGNGESYEPIAAIDRPAVLGQTLAPLAPGPLWRWDRTSELHLRLAGGALAARSDLAALSSEGLLAVEGVDGAWEILGFRDVELVASGVWKLRTLIRGQYGSEAAASRAVPAGARAVLLDTALTPLLEGPEALGQSAQFRVSEAGADHADPNAVAFEATASNVALLPLAPVHCQARREPSGIRLSWIRRTRRRGDNWEPADVPLGEEIEHYTLDVLAGGAVRRTMTATSPSLLYSAADEIADFGSAQPTISLRVTQDSRAAGRGLPLHATVPVRPA